MKTAMTLAALASAGLMLSATASSAASLDTRQTNLSHRIDQGVRNGSLTRAEASRLRRQLWSVERTQYNYRRGGLTWRERQDLQRRYDRISSHIRAQRHDWQRRW